MPNTIAHPDYRTSPPSAPAGQSPPPSPAGNLRPGTFRLIESYSRKRPGEYPTHRELAALEVASIRELRAKRLYHGYPLTKSSMEMFHIENLRREHRLHALTLRTRTRGQVVRPLLAAE